MEWLSCVWRLSCTAGPDSVCSVLQMPSKPEGKAAEIPCRKGAHRTSFRGTEQKVAACRPRGSIVAQGDIACQPGWFAVVSELPMRRLMRAPLKWGEQARCRGSGIRRRVHSLPSSFGEGFHRKGITPGKAQTTAQRFWFSHELKEHRRGRQLYFHRGWIARTTEAALAGPVG